MHDWIFTLVILSIAFYHSIYSSEVGCPFGWFGPNCDMKCQCENNSECDDGKCPKCRGSFFHRLCQYNIDLVESSGESPDESANITVGFHAPHFFTWMEVIPRHIESFTRFPILYGVDGEETCKDMRMQKKYDENVIVFRCLQYTLVSHLNFSLTPTSNISDLFISGGTNIAAKRYVRAGRLDRHTSDKKENLVDTDVKTCATLYKTESRLPFITVRLKEPQWVQRIMILGRRPSDLVHDMNVTIHYGRENETLKRSTYPYNMRINVYHPTQLKRATKLTIVGISIGTQYLDLCEIFIYGDCLWPSYGIECQEICSIGCRDLLCHTDGECFECMPGMTGFRCLDYNDTYEEEDYEEEEKEVVKEVQRRPKTKKDPFISGTDLLLMLLFSSALLASVATFVIYIVCTICTLDETSKKSDIGQSLNAPRSIVRSGGSQTESNSLNMYSTSTSTSKRRSRTE